MANWLLLIHRIPSRPLYLRARVRTRLERVGAVPVKHSVYAVPATADGASALEAIAGEIREQGGEAVLCEVRFAKTDEQRLIEASRLQRAQDYSELRKTSQQGPVDAARLARLERRLERITAMDHFEAGGRREAEAAIARLKRVAAPTPRERRWTGLTWVTRRGVHIDRMACAWFVRRFLDAGARFRFVGPGQASNPGDVGFDIPGGQFSHEGDRCSFETLIATAGRIDPALQRIAEIVHDVDLKDGKFDRPESAGVAQVVSGIASAEPSDEARIERGVALFDDLYRAFRGKPRPSVPARLLRPDREDR